MSGPMLAGELTMIEEGRKGNRATFQYDPHYLERIDAIPVDPIELPLQGTTASLLFATAEDFEVFGGIRDAVPDDWGQSLLYRDSGRTDLKLFDMLVAAGDDRVGALAFGPDTTGPRRVAPWADGQSNDLEFNLAEMQEAIKRLASTDEIDRRLRRFIIRGSSLGGARPKGVTNWKNYPTIAKFGRDDDVAKGMEQICRLEYATMKLAQICGIDVPDVDITTAGDRDVYLIRRFDRIPIPEIGAGSKIIGFWRKHFVSGLTMLAAHETEAHQQSYRALADRLRRLGARPRDDCRQLYRRMIFNILCNNNDDHLRNHGFLYEGNQKWRLSPAYDINPLPDHGDETRRLSLAVGRNKEGKLVRDASIDVALTDSNSFYFNLTEAKKLVQELVGRMRDWERHFSECGVSQATIERISSAFLRVHQFTMD